MPDTDKVMLSGWSRKLSNDRTVWLGEHPEGGYVVDFRTGEQHAVVRLSAETLDALLNIYQRRYAETAQPVADLIYRYVLEAVEGAAPTRVPVVAKEKAE